MFVSAAYGVWVDQLWSLADILKFNRRVRFDPKADKRECSSMVRFVLTADIDRRAGSFVCAHQGGCDGDRYHKTAAAAAHPKAKEEMLLRSR